jgi:archaellum biogenesis ATPase FlaH
MALEKSEIELLEHTVNRTKSAQSVCLSVSKKKFNETYVIVLKNLLSKPTARGVYVTVNTPFKRLVMELKEWGVPVERLFFVDAVSKIDQEWREGKQVIFLNSPHDLPNLTAGIAEALYLNSPRKKFAGKQNFVLLHSISSLLIYNKVETVQKFLEFLVDLTKGRYLKLFCLFEQGPGEKKIVPAIYNLFDEVIKLGD